MNDPGMALVLGLCLDDRVLHIDGVIPVTYIAYIPMYHSSTIQYEHVQNLNIRPYLQM